MTVPPTRQWKELRRSLARRLCGTILALTAWQASECAVEHLAGDLGVAWLVGADEAELVAAEDGDQAVKEQKAGDCEEDDELSRL